MRTRHLTGCGLHAIRVSQCCRSGAKAAIDWRAGSSGARYLATRSLTEVRTNDQTVGCIYKMRSDFLIAADHLPRQAPDKPKKQKETSNALAFFAENATGVPFIFLSPLVPQARPLWPLQFSSSHCMRYTPMRIAHIATI
eukprot:COSAG06_NODE_2140_length_7499_cov_5.035000_5_plen_140_part_00